ncbi:VOC family protein [Paenibacillus sp. Marseille-Q4541]|uniref:VOC family protein n=1 Tax=Paenibacillus sp. Marseille-Q4541 TaxID=2831522 RepID=UPI001BA7A28D|nr:VOC family protein [Paenibacillus sp. Marseille-Q4541]
MTYHYVGIDHVQLAAPPGCETEARHFYSAVLGFIEVPKPEALQKRGGVWFQCGSHQVHIGVQSDFTPATKAHPAFHVKHIEALRSSLLDQSISVIPDDARDDEGVIRFYIHDPFGNRIEFIEWDKQL